METITHDNTNVTRHLVEQRVTSGGSVSQVEQALTIAEFGRGQGRSKMTEIDAAEPHQNIVGRPGCDNCGVGGASGW